MLRKGRVRKGDDFWYLTMFSVYLLPSFCLPTLLQAYVLSLQLHCRLPEGKSQDFVFLPSTTMVDKEHRLNQNKYSPQNHSPWFRICWNLTGWSEPEVPGWKPQEYGFPQPYSDGFTGSGDSP